MKDELLREREHLTSLLIAEDGPIGWDALRIAALIEEVDNKLKTL